MVDGDHFLDLETMGRVRTSRAVSLCEELSHMTQGLLSTICQIIETRKKEGQVIHIHLFILSKIFIEYLSYVSAVKQNR